MGWFLSNLADHKELNEISACIEQYEALIAEEQQLDRIFEIVNIIETQCLEPAEQVAAISDEICQSLSEIKELHEKHQDTTDYLAFEKSIQGFIENRYELTLTIKDKALKDHLKAFSHTEKIHSNYKKSLLEEVIIQEIEVLHLLKQLNQAVNDLFTAENQIVFEIKEKVSPRFYEPTNPVILFYNKKETATAHFQPMMFYWNIEMNAISAASDSSETSKNYDTNSITKHFSTPSDAPDFRLKNNDKESGKEDVIQETVDNQHIGLTRLTEGSKELLVEQIKNYQSNIEQNEEDFTKAVLKSAKDILNQFTFYSQTLDGFNDAFLTYHPVAQVPIYVPQDGEVYAPLNQSINYMVGKDTSRFPFKISSFNPLRAGYLKFNRLDFFDSFGLKHELIVEKTASSDSKYLLKNFSTANTLDNPTRGQKIDFAAYEALLRPRFLQSTRLNTRWISAQSESNAVTETNNIHHSSPIAGWIVPNNLSKSLMIYDTDGTELGSLIARDNKVVFMAGYKRLYIDTKQVRNNYLRNFIHYIKDNSDSVKLLNSFLEVINQSQQYIEPDSFTSHPKYAIFTGKPLALVRMKLDLEGLGAYHYSHREQDGKFIIENIGTNDTINDTDTYQPLNKFCVKKITRDYENIEVPIRLGDFQQLNDGMIGYWRNTDSLQDYSNQHVNIEADEYFFAPIARSGKTLHDKILTINKKEELPKIRLSQSLAGQPTYINFLFDPMAKLNISSGILPVKTIDLPQSIYYDALRKIEITFLTAPVITPRRRLRLPIMEDPSFGWEWKFYDENPSDKKYITKDWFEQAFQAVMERNGSTVVWDKLIAKNILQEENIASDTLNWEDSDLSFEDFLNESTDNKRFFYNKSTLDDDWEDFDPKIAFILNNYAGRSIKTLPQDNVILKRDIEKGLTALKLDEYFNSNNVWTLLAEKQWIEIITTYYVVFPNDGITTLKGWQKEQLGNINAILRRYTPNQLGKIITEQQFENDCAVFYRELSSKKVEQLWQDLINLKYIQSFNDQAKLLETETTLGEEFKEYEEAFKWILSTYAKGIEPELTFPEDTLQEIREGWLKIISKH
jgi:hypothetical protein